ncbi:MAG: nucleotidyltransferase family protein [Anaerolineales bacterium]|nr:nucleotidyltransferase family protein [Anaerolineales bacterium]
MDDMTKLKLPRKQIEQFCTKWGVIELSLFGSVLRDDFRPDSDVDVLVTFSPKTRWTLFDHVDMQDELKTIFQREVDLVTRHGIERSQNEIRRQDILESAEVIYVQS